MQTHDNVIDGIIVIIISSYTVIYAAEDNTHGPCTAYYVIVMEGADCMLLLYYMHMVSMKSTQKGNMPALTAHTYSLLATR
jgi:hypothetical protein